MHEAQSESFFLKIAAVLREYETAHPNVYVTIDLTVVKGSARNGTRLLSASFAQKDLDFLRSSRVQSTSPPDDLSFHLTCISNAGHKEAALVLAKEIASVYPSDPNARKWLAEAYFGAKMPTEAAQSFNDAIRLAESPEWLEDHDLTCAIEIRWAFGGVNVLWGDVEAGCEHLSRAGDAANSLGLRDKAEWIADLIEQYRNAGSPDNAIE